MASFNKISIVGYLGRDPELRYTTQGTPVCDFSVATTERKKDRNGEPQDITTWFRVTYWGKLAEVASQYLSKGKLAYIEGRLSQREWQDREGLTRTSLEVNGTDLQFIGARGDEPSTSNVREERPKTVQDEPMGPVTDDDIPF